MKLKEFKCTHLIFANLKHQALGGKRTQEYPLCNILYQFTPQICVSYSTNPFFPNQNNVLINLFSPSLSTSFCFLSSIFLHLLTHTYLCPSNLITSGFFQSLFCSTCILEKVFSVPAYLIIPPFISSEYLYFPTFQCDHLFPTAVIFSRFTYSTGLVSLCKNVSMK